MKRDHATGSTIMMSSAGRVLRPHQHLPAQLRRVLEFDLAHPDIDAVPDALLADSLHLTREEYMVRLRDALTTPTTSPEESALAGIVRARRAGLDEADVDQSCVVEDDLIVGKQIRVNGRVFTVESDMAVIFLRHAERVVLSGNSDLVLLRHTRGLEMIPVLRNTPYDVSDITCATPADAAATRRRHGLRPRP